MAIDKKKLAHLAIEGIYSSSSRVADLPDGGGMGTGARMVIGELSSFAKAIQTHFKSGDEEAVQASIGVLIGQLGIVANNVGLEQYAAPLRKMGKEITQQYGSEKVSFTKPRR